MMHPSKFWTVAKHITLTGMAQITCGSFTSTAFLNKLPKDLKKVVMDAAKASTVHAGKWGMTSPELPRKSGRARKVLSYTSSLLLSKKSLSNGFAQSLTEFLVKIQRPKKSMQCSKRQRQQPANLKLYSETPPSRTGVFFFALCWVNATKIGCQIAHHQPSLSCKETYRQADK